VAELDELKPAPGEEAELDSRRRLMQAAGRNREEIARAHAALSHEGAEGLLAEALRRLEGVAGEAGGQLDAPLEALARALDELGHAQQGIEAWMDEAAFSPAELEATEERLFAIRALARKHGVLPDDLGELAEDLRRRLAALEGGAEDISRLEAGVEEARAAYDAAADALGQARREAAVRLDAAMAKELAPLKMERARFATEITPAEPGPAGMESVAFTVATNPGAPPGPLQRIASGGELSRFLLAIKVCLSNQAAGMTMIFDEIDRGVGGATADAVGRRLAALAQEAQVLVVTHSPQVAARGQHHWKVEKEVSGGMTTSRVIPLDEAARIDELARMLAGDTVTAEARAAARALLAG